MLENGKIIYYGYCFFTLYFGVHYLMIGISKMLIFHEMWMSKVDPLWFGIYAFTEFFGVVLIILSFHIYTKYILKRGDKS